MKIGFRMKLLRFDAPAVRRMFDTKTRRAMLRFGQYARKVARHSLKTKAGPSAPGTPPHSQTGLLKSFLMYGVDRGSRSVVIGPMKLQYKGYGPLTVPEVQEYGATVRSRRGLQATYPARPYMQPAFEAGQAKLDDFWKDSVK